MWFKTIDLMGDAETFELSLSGLVQHAQEREVSGASIELHRFCTS
jgi:hypothetical protein